MTGNPKAGFTCCRQGLARLQVRRSRYWICLLLAFGFIKGITAQELVKPQVDHVAIYVADLQKSVAFYKDTFGFEQIPIPVKIAAWLSMGKGVMLHIVVGRKEPVANTK